MSETRNLPFDTAQMRTIFYDHKNLSSSASARDNIVDQLQHALSTNPASPVSVGRDLSKPDAASGEKPLRSLLVAVDNMHGRFSSFEGYLQQLVSEAPRTDEDMFGDPIMMLAWLRRAVGVLEGETRNIVLDRFGLKTGHIADADELADKYDMTVGEISALLQQVNSIWTSEGFRQEFYRQM